jgi:Holliday junction resolvase-like predicted endonuclease
VSEPARAGELRELLERARTRHAPPAAFDTREALARLLGCAAADVALMDSATRAWAQLFYAVPLAAGDRILLSRAEYASNAIAALQRARRHGATIEVVPADPAGELDLIALDGRTLVVVEVRSTASDIPEALDNTAASVDLRKQRKITEATLRFLAARKLLGKIAVRFDVIVLVWPPQAGEPVVRHYTNAFEATGKFQMFS